MENKETIYPVGVQSFEKIREEGYIYIDKTSFIYDLAKTGSYVFLSRPRRFGKSLFLSTLKAYFEGKKELFKGLKIEKMEKEWVKYPVLYLDLNTKEYSSDADLKERLDASLSEWEKLYGGSPERSLELRFESVIQCAKEKTGHDVVILVDEYDKPLLENIGNKDLQEKYRKTLKAFYGNLKSMDGCIKFAFITGVTKFSKVSIFSDLNNLEDISLDAQYNSICGMTEDELQANFKEGIQKLSRNTKQTYEDTCASLKKMYDGYHFYPESEGVYNPFSILQCLKKGSMDSFWFESGTPSFLVELLKETDYDLERLSNEDVDGDVLNSLDTLQLNPVPVIYQAGYLTIKGYDSEFQSYQLGFPNYEVERGFLKYLLPFYSAQKTDSNFSIKEFVKDLRGGNAEGFMKRIQAFFCDSDYRVAGKIEKYFQNVMYLLFRLIGFHSQVERTTSSGRIDVTVKTAKYIYIIELKRDKTAKEALLQIEEKGYADVFAMDGRKVIKIGVNFSSEKRGITEWVIGE